MSKVQIYFEDISPEKIDKKLIKHKCKELIINELKTPGNISLIFCSDKYLLGMNEQYLDHNYYTDIITFNYVENGVISGDLFISIDRVKENAFQMKVSFGNELFRVIFHGLLHLIGYNDRDGKEKRTMREKEDFYLKNLNLGGRQL